MSVPPVGIVSPTDSPPMPKPGNPSAAVAAALLVTGCGDSTTGIGPGNQLEIQNEVDQFQFAFVHPVGSAGGEYFGEVVPRLGRVAAFVARGLDLGAVQTDPSLPTGTVDVDASDPNAPTYVIHQPVAWDALELDDALRGLAGRADAVCFGTLAQRDARSRACIHGFLEAAAHAFRLYDVNLRQHYHDRAWVERSLQAADAVKLNEDEVAAVATMLGASPS